MNPHGEEENHYLQGPRRGGHRAIRLIYRRQGNASEGRGSCNIMTDSHPGSAALDHSEPLFPFSVKELLVIVAGRGLLYQSRERGAPGWLNH